MRDTENKDEQGNPIEEIVYATDDKGNLIEFPDYIPVMTRGDTVQNFKNTTENIADVIIIYNGFSYSKESLNKEDFAPDQLEENNIYTTELPASELMPGTPKIFLGVVKYNGEQINYATNAVEFEVTRSIETANWESMEEFLNEKLVFATYNAEANAYHEIGATPDAFGNINFLEGRENYIYIDVNETDPVTEKFTVRKWNPEQGYYKLKPASNIVI